MDVAIVLLWKQPNRLEEPLRMFKRAAFWCSATLWVVFLIACSGGGSSPRRLSGFALRIDRGVFSHDLLIMNNEPLELDHVNVTITTMLEDGTKPQINRFWESWKFGEVKKINIPAGAALQTIQMSGSGHMPEGYANLYCGWSANRSKGK